jgi:hypothetical protein
VDDSGFPRTPDRLFKLCGAHVQQSEALKAMIGTCGPYNLGGFATARFGGEPPGVFQNLPTYVSRWNCIITFDMYVRLDGFLDIPCRNHRFTKTSEIC